MSKRQFWTDGEIAELRRRYEAREFLKDIAKAMGRSHCAVKSQVSEQRDIWAGRRLAVKPAVIGDVTGRNNESQHLRLVAPHGGFTWLRPDIAERLYVMERPTRRAREFWRAA